MKNKNSNFKDELSKQYDILIKAEKKEQKKRTITFFSIFLLTFLASIFCVFFSYRSYKNTKSIIIAKESKTETFYQTLSISYSTDSNFNIDNITTNYDLVNPMVIKITNDGNVNVNFDIVISNISSSLANTANLLYTITKNGETSSPKSLPLSDASLVTDAKITPQETITYIIKANYTGNIEEGTTANFYHSKINVIQNNTKSSLLE